ncbi:hypothetical protein [Desulfovibrio sp.]|uniref:hypothetical protein n=1 Tax=Desulfovibrio sp. TaxID=885 RepID=UPI0025C3C5BA|nr:hypothetical protein [Desulfovibrio sp.]
METQKIAHFETLLGRELTVEEKDRLRRIKDTLQIADNDALWDVIIALEYQRKYYDELPEKISSAAAEILNGLSQAAEKEIALAQGRLAESVVEQAKKMSLKMHVQSWIQWGVFALLLLMLYGSLLLWAGYSIGSGQTHHPAMLLRMPVGVLIGALCFGCGIWGSILAAKDFSEGKVVWRKRLLMAFCCLLPGAWMFSLALF